MLMNAYLANIIIEVTDIKLIGGIRLGMWIEGLQYLLVFTFTTVLSERTWTEWYNSDSPYSGGLDDDESVDSLRKRGYPICTGGYAVEAECREAANRTVTFTTKTRYLAINFLAIPCSTRGLLCRDIDQTGDTCKDYEIRFECLVSSPPSPSSVDTVVIIIVGCFAGICVVGPMICALVMHIRRRRRQRGRQPEQQQHQLQPVSSVEQFAQTQVTDLPPSYSGLFEEGVLGRPTLTLSRSGSSVVSLTVSTADGVFDISLPSSQNENGRNSDTADRSVNQATTPRTSAISNQRVDEQQNAHSLQNRRRTSSLRQSFPNLHLSVFEIRSPSDPALPSTSSVKSDGCTTSPPPSYKDAIIITAKKDLCLQIPRGSALWGPVVISNVPSVPNSQESFNRTSLPESCTQGSSDTSNNLDNGGSNESHAQQGRDFLQDSQASRNAEGSTEENCIHVQNCARADCGDINSSLEILGRNNLGFNDESGETDPYVHDIGIYIENDTEL